MPSPNFINLLEELHDMIGQIEPDFARADAIALILKSALGDNHVQQN